MTDEEAIARVAGMYENLTPLSPINPSYLRKDRLCELVMSMDGQSPLRMFVMRFPMDLTIEEVGDIEDSFSIALRGMKRRANKLAECSATPPSSYSDRSPCGKPPDADRPAAG